MSPQETQVLQNFLDQLVKVQGINKDPQAQSLINDAVSKQADASYLLVQRALLMEQALATANSQIANLQADIRELRMQRPASPAGNFLDPASNSWGNSSRSASLPPPIPAGYSSNVYNSNTAPMTAMAPPASGFFGNGVGNVLGTVATTAAGVAAGAFLFQGIEHLMGNSTHHQMLDNTASQFNQGGGDLLPGYFDQGVNNVPVSSNDISADDSTASFDDSSDDGDSLDLA